MILCQENLKKRKLDAIITRKREENVITMRKKQCFIKKHLKKDKYICHYPEKIKKNLVLSWENNERCPYDEKM